MSQVAFRGEIIGDWGSLKIPRRVTNHATFRRWAREDRTAEKRRIYYLAGYYWINISREELFTHNQVTVAYTVVLGRIASSERRGMYVTDGMLLSNTEAGYSVEPDGCFVSTSALREKRVRLVRGREGGIVELEGTPEMVLEIVSTSSVKKDTSTLRDLYWQAGIPEYWLVDARGQTPSFEILRYTERGYVSGRKRAGRLRSSVFDKSFRLLRTVDELGNPVFVLEVKD